MAIEATDVTQVTVNPTSIRYSLNVDKFTDVSRGRLQLQRSEKRQDGTWMDDPHPGSSKSVPIPDSCNAAWLGVEAVLPSILTRIGVTDAYNGYRLQLLGSLSAAGVLDVIVVVQLMTAGGWKCASVPSLTAFLTANQDLAIQILTAWDGLDAAINAANAESRWL